jgi:hypothetical protein
LVLALALGCGSDGGGDGGDGDGDGDGDVDAGTSEGPGSDAASGADADVDEGGERIVFVTSSTQNGSLGGVEGADALCATRAADAELEGTFRAWLSEPGETAADRLVHGTGPYVRTDGVRVAADWDDLTDGSIEASINRDENGDSAGGDVWTGTTVSGGLALDHCDGFSTSQGVGLCGDSGSTSSSWSENFTPLCLTQLRLYCIQQ